MPLGDPCRLRGEARRRREDGVRPARARAAVRLGAHVLEQGRLLAFYEAALAVVAGPRTASYHVVEQSQRVLIVAEQHDTRI